MNTYPSPWNFSNADENLQVRNGRLKIEYADVSEIAMGGPLGGRCFLVSDGVRFILHDHCGGPAVWNEAENKVAVPVWTKSRVQQIGVVDVDNKVFTIYQPLFAVLHLTNFDGNEVKGIDSPIYNKRPLVFDISSAGIASKTLL